MEKRNSFLKKGYKFKPYTKKEATKFEKDFEPLPPNWNAEGFMDIGHVVMIKTEDKPSELNPFVVGDLQSDIIEDPSKIKKGKGELVYVGNATNIDTDRLKDALKFVSTKKFAPTSFQIISGGRKVTVKKVEEEFSFDFDEDFDDDSLDDFDDDKKVETFEIVAPVPSEVIFYDDKNAMFRTAVIAPRVFDDIDEEVNAMNKRYDSFLEIQDTCNPESVERFDGMIKDSAIVPANVFFNDGYQPASLKNTDPNDFLKNYNKYKKTKIKDEKYGLENVIGYNVNCGSPIDDTKDCNKNFCFVPFESGKEDGLLITGKKVLRKVGTCLDAKEASSKLYSTKKTFNGNVRLLSKFTGLSQKKIKENGTVCVLEPTKKQWRSDSYKAKMFKMGDQILGYEGERDFLLG